MTDPPRATYPPWLRLLALLFLLFLFLTAVKLLGGTFKMMGKDAVHDLFAGVSNPVAALCVGILATVIVQSSSVTTSTIVALVGSGQISVAHAVPMVMGANIGTSVTNTLVSIGHITRSEEFRRAFAGATMHDFFNILAVLVLLPLELATGVLSNLATHLTGLFNLGGEKFDNPLKHALGWFAKEIQHFVTGPLGLQGWVAAAALLLIALGLIVISLRYITVNMRLLMADRLERALNDVLGRSGILAIAIGVLMTMAVQSSSITTSLLVPMIGAGVLTLEAAFPVTLGANIGTTVTAIIASLASDQATGLTIALVHLLFNFVGVAIIYPWPALRRIPIRMAQFLATMATASRAWVAVYIAGTFVVLPLLGVLLLR